jgi:hypothetical protein
MMHGIFERLPADARIGLHPACGSHHFQRISGSHQYLGKQCIRIKRNGRDQLLELRRGPRRRFVLSVHGADVHDGNAQNGQGKIAANGLAERREVCHLLASLCSLLNSAVRGLTRESVMAGSIRNRASGIAS